jgi:hypothetical protein
MSEGFYRVAVRRRPAKIFLMGSYCLKSTLVFSLVARC